MNVYTGVSASSKSYESPSTKRPFEFETEDGKVFQARYNGTPQFYEGVPAPYYWCVSGCPGSSQWAAYGFDGEGTDTLNQSEDLWKVKISEYKARPYTPTTVGVKRAWFVGGDKSSSGSSHSTTANVPDKAYHGVGTSVPGSAEELRSSWATTNDSGEDEFLLVSPTGNLGCVINADGSSARCGVESFRKKKSHLGTTNGDPNWAFNLGGSATKSAPQLISERSGTDWQEKLNPSGDQYEVEYGDAVYKGNIVCASEEAGMTCWDTKTGHGAFMHRDDIETF